MMLDIPLCLAIFIGSFIRCLDVSLKNSPVLLSFLLKALEKAYYVYIEQDSHLDIGWLVNLGMCSVWLWSLLSSKYNLKQRSAMHMGYMTVAEMFHFVHLFFAFPLSSFTQGIYSNNRSHLVVTYFHINAFWGRSSDLFYLACCSLNLALALGTSYQLHDQGHVVGTWTSMFITKVVLSRMLVPLILIASGFLIRRHYQKTIKTRNIEIGCISLSSRDGPVLSPLDQARALVTKASLGPPPYIPEDNEETFLAKIEGRELEDLAPDAMSLLQQAISKHLGPLR